MLIKIYGITVLTNYFLYRLPPTVAQCSRSCNDDIVNVMSSCYLLLAKYRDVGHVEGYISETVQDTASRTINDYYEIIPVESNGTTMNSLGWPLIRVMGPQFGETT